MTHNEKRAHWVREASIGLGVGVLYGVTVVVSAHPFDTIKTKMQAQKGFENSSMVNTFVRTFKAEGLKGLYRGWVPPLIGSGIYRSIQFSKFEAVYTFLDNDFGRTKIPFSHGVEFRVVLAGIASGTARSVIETPLEYAKIKRQMGETWELRKCYTGMGITWMRACTLMPTYFIVFDSLRRHNDELFRSNMMGPFIASGISSVLGWWVCWPLELIKCQIQADYMGEKKMSIFQRLRFIVREHGGVLALYRGIMPGSIRSFIGNGTGMIVMQYAQKKVTEFGLRD